jgi:arylformamidase
VSLIDISTPIENGMGGFPGDPRVRLERVRSLDRGDAYNLSSMEMGTHTGTHVDPPIHFLPGGATIDQVALDRLNGSCYVARLPVSVRTVRATDLAAVPQGVERLLLRTSNSDRWAAGPQFFPDYVALDPTAAEVIVSRGVRLVGIDALSIESDPTGRFPVHHRLLAAGVLILEGLRLAAVEPGGYELHLLPLRIAGGDGGPARAALATR